MLQWKTMSAGLLIAALTVVGCSKPTNKAPQGAKAGSKHSHDHEHGVGPKGGQVFEIGAYHAEIVIDRDKKECTLYILGDDQKSPAQLSAKELSFATKAGKAHDGKAVPAMSFKLLPKDAANGKASQFVGGDPGLGVDAELEVFIVGEVDGKAASGKVHVKDEHDDHDHDHKKKK